MNKKRLLGGATWLVTISALVLWFPIIALGVLKVKEWITSSSIYQSLITTSRMNGYEPEAINSMSYAIMASTKDWVMMFGTLALAIILWAFKIKSNKKGKK